MAFFVKKQYAQDQALYTVSEDKRTFLIIGLGNTGREYDNTRHNIGFMILDSFAAAQEFPRWHDKSSLFCQTSDKQTSGSKIILAKPISMMNSSGQAVHALKNYFKLGNENIMIIHDDIDVEFGQIKIKTGGSSGGHNGVQSVIDSIGEDFLRLRVGIGPKRPRQIDSADFVLARFNKSELSALGALDKETASIINEYIHGQGQLPSETRTWLFSS